MFSSPKLKQFNSFLHTFKNFSTAKAGGNLYTWGIIPAGTGFKKHYADFAGNNNLPKKLDFFDNNV